MYLPGSVDGMLRTLSQLEADFSPMPMSIYEDRILVCDFTVQFDNYVMGLVGQQNEKPEINYLAFLLLFNWDTWFVISMLLVAMASLLFLLGK